MTSWLKLMEEESKRAKIDAKQSFTEAMNSYGSGYDKGYVDGLAFAIALQRLKNYK